MRGLHGAEASACVPSSVCFLQLSAPAGQTNSSVRTASVSMAAGSAMA